MAGGGYGEAALMGAAFGAGRSLLSGKGDPLEGGIKGAMLGAAGNGALNMFSPAAAGAGLAPVEDLAAKEVLAGQVAGSPEFGYTWNQATGMLEPATASRLAESMSGAPGAWNVGQTPDAMAQFYGSDMAGQGGGGISTLPTGPGATVAPNPPIPSAAGTRLHERTDNAFLKDPLEWMSQNKMKTAAGALGLYTLANWNNLKNPNYLKPYQPPTAEQYGLGARLSPNYRPTVPMQAGGVVEQMSNANAIGQNTGYPQSGITQGAYSTPWQTPVSRNVLEGASDTAVDPITGQMKFAAGGVTGSGNLDLHIPIDLGGGTSGSGSPMNAFQSANSGPQAAFSGYNNDSSNILNDTFVGTKAFSGNTQEGLNSLFSMLGGKAMASGGIASLGSYSDGGRLLKGPGDGMSDSIPASIGNKQPARLGDGEFVVPADVVSHLGNGSTDAGAKQLYKMMDKVRQARTGRKSQGKQINPRKYMPA